MTLLYKLWFKFVMLSLKFGMIEKKGKDELLKIYNRKINKGKIYEYRSL